MTQAAKEIRDLRNQVKHLESVVKKNYANSNSHNGLPFGLDADELTSIAKKAGETVRTFVDEKTEAATQMYHDGEELVASNPLRSIAIAAAAGALLSAVIAGFSRTRQ